MARVILEQVKKVYPGNVTAVHPMDLDIPHGEFTVLVGPSGCGKSTTLRMIAGLEDITSGKISIGDRIVNHVEPRDRDIAMVFQSYALYPHMTVSDNMGFGLKMRKTPRQEISQRVKNAAEILGISELLERKPKALSGGQRQRVALGRAIVRDPAVFLFDEPLSNLDAKMRVQMRTEIARLHHQLDATMIYVTHDQTEAMTLGERIVVMKDGVVQQVAPPLELYSQPANQFVGGFIGSPAMNFLPGKLARSDGLKFIADPHPDSGETTTINLHESHVITAGLLDQALVMGIRPEHMIMASDPSGAALRSPLQVKESLGNETLAYLNVAGRQFTMRSPGQITAALDDELAVNLMPEHIHFFDAGSELAV